MVLAILVVVLCMLADKVMVVITNLMVLDVSLVIVAVSHGWFL